VLQQKTFPGYVARPDLRTIYIVYEGTSPVAASVNVKSQTLSAISDGQAWSTFTMFNTHSRKVETRDFQLLKENKLEYLGVGGGCTIMFYK
jgi:hypothetical protein